MTALINYEASSFEEVAQHDVWQEAMVEYDSIMKNRVWEVVPSPRPEDKKVVGSKWIYKVKHATNRSVEKYKERFVGKGFSQKRVLSMRRPSPQ